MAARAIVGIALGIFFAPILYFLATGVLMLWFQSISNIQLWTIAWMAGGLTSAYAPMMGLFDGSITIDLFLMLFAVGMIVWIMIGMWAGAIERSAKRGIGVALGVWLGWLIIGIIGLYMIPEVAAALLLLGITDIVSLLLGMLWNLILVILIAAMFGAITKSEEF